MWLQLRYNGCFFSNFFWVIKFLYTSSSLSFACIVFQFVNYNKKKVQGQSTKAFTLDTVKGHINTHSYQGNIHVLDKSISEQLPPKVIYENIKNLFPFKGLFLIDFFEKFKLFFVFINFYYP